MNSEQQAIHARAISIRDRFREFEMEFIKILLDVERSKLHRAKGYPSVFAYAVHELQFTESVAYMFIAVARKSREVPALLESGLSVFKSSRLVSTLTPENAFELLTYASTHTTREVDAEVARRNPKARPEKIKLLSNEVVEIILHVSNSFTEKTSAG